MRLGRLRHRVTLQRPERVEDDGGGYREDWVEVRPVWVSIDLPSGRLQEMAQQIQNPVRAEITARRADDLQAGCRLIQGSTTYRIEAALPDNTGARVRLLCSTVTPTPR